AGEAFFSVRARISEHDAAFALTLERLCVPDDLVEPLDAAVQGIRPIVGGALVGRSVQRELGVADSVAVAADQRTKIGTALEISIDRLVPQRDIAECAIAVRYLQRSDDSTVVRDADFHAGSVAERVQFQGCAVG